MKIARAAALIVLFGALAALLTWPLATTLGTHVPIFLNDHTGASMPNWWK